MTRPRIFKQDNIWQCISGKYIGKGNTPTEAFFNFMLTRALCRVQPE